MKNGNEGVYPDTKKDGSLNYRASLTKNNKHISLGSYETLNDAHEAYDYAKKLFSSSKLAIRLLASEELLIAKPPYKYIYDRKYTHFWYFNIGKKSFKADFSRKIT